MIYFLSDHTIFYVVLSAMTILAVIVFFALHRITAPYGINFSNAWGPSLPNRAGWVVMEAPAFFAMLVIWLLSPRPDNPATAVLASLFLLHYFQRSFIFPLLIKGRNRMPWVIILSGALFNIINAYLIGSWIFFIAPEGMYTSGWLSSPSSSSAP